MLTRETAADARKTDEEISPGFKRLLGIREPNALTVIASYYPDVSFSLRADGMVRMKLPRTLSPAAVMKSVPSHLNAQVDGHGLLLTLKSNDLSPVPSPSCGPSDQKHEASLSALKAPARELQEVVRARRSIYPLAVRRACEALSLGAKEEHALFQAHRDGVKIHVQQFKQSCNAERVEFSGVERLGKRGPETLLKALGFHNVSTSVWNEEWRTMPSAPVSPVFKAKIDFGSSVTVSITKVSSS